MGFEEFAEEGGNVFAEFAIVGAEGGEEVGVNVEFAGDFAMDEDGNNDFGFRFERAGEVTSVGVDVIHDNGFAGGGCGSANALIERDAGVRGHGAFERAEDEDVMVGLPFEHVETDPVVTGHFFVEQGDDGVHESDAGGGVARQSIEFGKQVRGSKI